MFENMNPSEAYSDDGGNEWIILVRGKDESDHLFSVYGASKKEVESKASYLIMALNTYRQARHMISSIGRISPEEQKSIWDIVSEHKDIDIL